MLVSQQACGSERDVKGTRTRGTASTMSAMSIKKRTTVGPRYSLEGLNAIRTVHTLVVFSRVDVTSQSVLPRSVQDPSWCH